jgi:glycosyltransferase involved in cell wall biosynthesis
VLTYRREEELRTLVPMLLEELASARTAASTVTGIEVLVVDNDPDRGAAPVVLPMTQDAPVRYVAEPTPGIAAARNRALDEAAADGIVVFIDDDERPVPGWLTAILRTWEEHHCAAVGGPVEAVLTGEIDPWITAGGFFERTFRSGFRTGEPVAVAPTGNILLDMTAINRHGLRFDASLGLAGGEDTLFTRSLVASGEQIIWCVEAVVLDPVPSSRLTRRWVVSRVFHVSNASINAIRRSATSRVASVLVRCRYAVMGGARLVLGSSQVVAGTLTGQVRLQARGAGIAARGAGALTAAMGLRFQEYRR